MITRAHVHSSQRCVQEPAVAQRISLKALSLNLEKFHRLSSSPSPSAISHCCQPLSPSSGGEIPPVQVESMMSVLCDEFLYPDTHISLFTSIRLAVNFQLYCIT